MAKTFKTKTGEHYIALSNMEKRYIYRLGCNIIREVHRRTEEGILPPRWNDHDINALEIPLLCEPLESDGLFLDLLVQQVHKLDKCLMKLFESTFEEVFDVTVETDQPLTKEEVFVRMEEYREHKSRIQKLKIINSKNDLLAQSGLFY